MSLSRRTKIDPATKSKKWSALLEWSKQGSLKNQRKSLVGAINDENSIVNAPAASLDNWSKHWKDVFKQIDTVPELAEAFLDSHGSKLPECILWTVSFETFCQWLAATHDSAPGPDGIMYSAYAKGGDYAKSCLCSLYLHVINSEDQPYAISTMRISFYCLRATAPKRIWAVNIEYGLTHFRWHLLNVTKKLLRPC